MKCKGENVMRNKNTKQLLDEHDVYDILSDSMYNEHFENDCQYIDSVTRTNIITSNLLNVLNYYFMCDNLDERLWTKCLPFTHPNPKYPTFGHPHKMYPTFKFGDFKITFEDYFREFDRMLHVESVYYEGKIDYEGKNSLIDKGEYYLIECIDIDGNDISLILIVSYYGDHDHFQIHNVFKVCHYEMNRISCKDDLFFSKISCYLENDAKLSYMSIVDDKSNWIDNMNRLGMDNFECIIHYENCLEYSRTMIGIWGGNTF